MALTNSPLDPRFTDVVVKDTQVNNTAAESISGNRYTFHTIEITNDAGQRDYVKFYDASSATAATLPNMIFMVASGLTRTISICDGYSFGTAVTMRCVQEAGLGGTTSPSGGTSGNVQVILTLS